MEELAGGGSFMLRVGAGREASKALMEEGMYVTSMDGCGESHGVVFVRFVFFKEPCHRLKSIGTKVEAVLERSRGNSKAA